MRTEKSWIFLFETNNGFVPQFALLHQYRLFTGREPACILWWVREPEVLVDQALLQPVV